MTGHSIPDEVLRAQSRGIITSLDLLGTLLLIQLLRRQGVIAGGAYCWHMFNLSTSSCSARLCFIKSVTSLSCYMVLLYSRYKTLYLVLWKFKRFLSGYFYSLSKSFSVAALPSNIYPLPLTHVFARSVFCSVVQVNKDAEQFLPGYWVPRKVTSNQLSVRLLVADCDSLKHFSLAKSSRLV